MLRNSAYRGVACFGKTRASARTRVTRPLRRRGVITPSVTVGHERPREEWIEIPVPAPVSEESFARVPELLKENKIRSRRRTIEPSIVQGLVSCQKCGYAFSRTSTQTSARKIHYYKCLGSNSWRKLGGPVCDNGRFVRQDLLDQIVWAEVIRLLEDPALIQQELNRRLEAARSSDPTKKREQSLQRESAHVGKSIERLLSAYQEALMSIEQLRERMPALRQREQALRTELQAISDQANDQAAFLRLAETLTAFLARLRGAADTLSITERQRIVRLVVKDVLIGDDTITIRHSIPVPQGPQQGGDLPPNRTDGRNYLLCKGSDFADPRQYLSALCFRSMGGCLAQEVCARRGGGHPLRGRYHLRLPASIRCRSFSGEFRGTAAEVWVGAASRENAPDRVRAVCRTRPGTKRRRKAGDVRLSWLHAHQRKNRRGAFTVRRTTICKRMRKKLQEIKQQLRQRMHDPAPKTGEWLRLVVQGYYNYYAVPGNLDSLGVFRDRPLRFWGQSLRRRSQKRRPTWACRVALADRWLPHPRVLHPYPADRFAASHPR